MFPLRAIDIRRERVFREEFRLKRRKFHTKLLIIYLIFAKSSYGKGLKGFVPEVSTIYLGGGSIY